MGLAVTTGKRARHYPDLGLGVPGRRSDPGGTSSLRILEISCLLLLCAVSFEPTAADGSGFGIRRVGPARREPLSTVPLTELRWVKLTTEPFDPETLAQRLRNTKAIGFFTKLQLKGDIEDLVQELEELHKGKTLPTLAQLHERFQLLLHKIITLVQDKDPALAKSITDARPSLWQWLSDPNKSVNL